MSDGPETTQLNERPAGMPPLFLLGGFILAATAGSAYFVLPDGQQTTTVSSTLVIPGSGGPVESPSEATTPATDQPVVPSESGPEQVDSKVDRISRLIVGDWQQEFYGKRTLTVKANGTATMTILPSGVFALGFGSKIDLTMFWSVKDGHLDYGVSGGVPEDKVKLAAKTWGDHWVEKIITLDEDKLDLLSEDGSSHSIWERVPREEVSTTEGQSP